MATYAKRMARNIDPGCPCLIGGASFGGIVALEAAHYLQAKTCLLFASSRDVQGLPTGLRMARRLSKLLSAETVWRLMMLGQEAAVATTPSVRSRRKRLSSDQRQFRDWALSALLSWKSSDAACPIMQMHGSEDNVFDVRRTRAETIIAGAGHVLTRTHHEEVNQFIVSALERSYSSDLGVITGLQTSRYHHE
ncbi:alpha/beta fold hydrolase [Undibacterium sp. Ji49W]|uniref:alpha/beta fold hydrolase n=1 Tax=Undibacterium sp. Ji49W TaxID=3413040 RepID=UPI003BEFCCA4